MESGESRPEESLKDNQHEEMDDECKEVSGVVMNLMNQLNQEELKAAEEDEVDFKFCKRQSTRGT